MNHAMVIISKFLWSRFRRYFAGPLLWGPSETVVKVSVVCGYLKAHLGKAVLPVSLLAGYSSSWAFGVRTLVPS